MTNNYMLKNVSRNSNIEPGSRHVTNNSTGLHMPRQIVYRQWSNYRIVEVDEYSVLT